MPWVVVRETGYARGFHAEIHASVPGIGLVAGYVGHLNLPSDGIF
jgi:hypothetical protein